MSIINQHLDKFKKLQEVYAQQVKHQGKKPLTLGIFAFEYPVADKKSVIDKILNNILEAKPCMFSDLDYYEKKVAMDGEIGLTVKAYLEQRKMIQDEQDYQNSLCMERIQ